MDIMQAITAVQQIACLYHNPVSFSAPPAVMLLLTSTSLVRPSQLDIMMLAQDRTHLASMRLGSSLDSHLLPAKL